MKGLVFLKKGNSMKNKEIIKASLVGLGASGFIVSFIFLSLDKFIIGTILMGLSVFKLVTIGTFAMLKAWR